MGDFFVSTLDSHYEQAGRWWEARKDTFCNRAVLWRYGSDGGHAKYVTPEAGEALQSLVIRHYRAAVADGLSPPADAAPIMFARKHSRGIAQLKG